MINFLKIMNYQSQVKISFSSAWILAWLLIFPIDVFATSAAGGSFFPPEAPEINLISPKTDLFVGESIQLLVEATNADGSTTDVSNDPAVRYVFSSSTTEVNTEAATLSPGGFLTATERGDIQITAEFSLATDVSGSNLIFIHIRLPGDTDDDGMPDAFEILHGLNPNDPADGELDNDGDTLTNREEFEQGTDPNNIDSDGDTFTDAVEISLKMDPNSPDERLLIPPSLILNDNCVVTALNRSVQVNPDGTFAGAVPTPAGQFWNYYQQKSFLKSPVF